MPRLAGSEFSTLLRCATFLTMTTAGLLLLNVHSNKLFSSLADFESDCHGEEKRQISKDVNLPHRTNGTKLYEIFEL
jgi:ABC-type histidine transport system ATPase subunit